MNIRENFDRWMFDYKEGNLSIAEEQEFENFLMNNPEFDVDADAWDMAYIQSEPVEYPFQEKLERKRRVVGWYYWSAAASLILLLGVTGLYIFNSNNSLTESNQSTSLNLIQTDKVNGQENSVESRVNAILKPLTGDEQFAFVSHHSNINSNSQNEHLNSVYNNLNQTTTNSSVENSSFDFVNSANVDLVSNELEKLNGKGHVAKYDKNPESSSLGFDISKKSSHSSGSSRSAFKKFYRKVEKMLGYPPGLTNLRDPSLLIPQNSLLSFNSSFAGGMLKSRFDMNYRNQWLGNSQNSQELTLSFDNYSYGLRGGVGFMLNAQDYGYGKFGDYNMSVFYSPKLVLTKNVVIEPSVKLTLGTLNANGNAMSSNTAFEMDRGRVLLSGTESQMNGFTRQWYKDYGMGLMVNTKWFYMGVNADNLSQHYENVYGNNLSSPTKSPIKVSALVGTDYKSNKKTMILSPFVAYQQFGNQTDIWGGLSYRQNWFIMGGSVSMKQEFVASVGVKFDGFKLMYQYDYTNSMLTGEKIGSHNIGIRINSKRKTSRLTH